MNGEEWARKELLPALGLESREIEKIVVSFDWRDCLLKVRITETVLEAKSLQRNTVTLVEPPVMKNATCRHHYGPLDERVRGYTCMKCGHILSKEAIHERV